jgi:hypothetical protein
LPNRPFEDIDEKTLIDSEKKRQRSDEISDRFDGLMLGYLRLFVRSTDPLKKDTVSEGEWKRVKHAEKGKIPIQRATPSKKKLYPRVSLKELQENPFKPDPENRLSSVFNTIDTEPIKSPRGKRKRK